MIISSKSIMSGLSRSKDIDVTYIQLLNWHQGALIQNAMPNVSSEDRDFIKGIFWNECGLDDVADVYSDDLDEYMNECMYGDDYENS